jgi:uncharacterized alkaline shock family protein YloU
MNPIPMNDAGTDLGSIQIAPEVLEIIAGQAAAEVEGVAAMGGGIADGIAGMIGRKNPARGVRVTVEGDRAVVELSIAVRYGFRIPDVCDQIGRAVKHAIQSMTGIEVSEVHIHIHGVQFKDKPAEQDEPAAGRVK